MCLRSIRTYVRWTPNNNHNNNHNTAATAYTLRLWKGIFRFCFSNLLSSVRYAVWMLWSVCSAFTNTHTHTQTLHWAKSVTTYGTFEHCWTLTIRRAIFWINWTKFPKNWKDRIEKQFAICARDYSEVKRKWHTEEKTVLCSDWERKKKFPNHNWITFSAVCPRESVK